MSEILDYYVTKKFTRSFKPLAPDYYYANNMHCNNMLVPSPITAAGILHVFFVFLPLQPIVVVFSQPGSRL
jgi:hypothetical protein